MGGDAEAQGALTAVPGAAPRSVGPAVWLAAALLLFALGALGAWLVDGSRAGYPPCATTGPRPLDLDGCDLRGQDVGDVSFAGAHLRAARLDGVDLHDADLRGAQLQGAVADGADLAGAALDGAQLQGASLRGADLTGACLAGASLRGADLRDSDLTGAGLAGAELVGVDLAVALGVDGVPDRSAACAPG